MKVSIFAYKDSAIDYCSNTYILNDEEGNAIIIDPSKDYDGIVNFLNTNNLKPQAILLTHGHFDHIRGIKNLLNSFNIPVYIHFLDQDYLNDPELNCSSYMDNDIVKIDITPKNIKDGEILNIFKTEGIKVIHTPYHTPGSSCFYLEKSRILFSGDSLFQHGIGRSDLPGGDRKLIRSSLNKIFMLSDDVTVYPGHGPKTTIGHEKSVNVLND